MIMTNQKSISSDKNFSHVGNRIEILDDLVINKIAAGEVIERPASIVKELVENSIDAGANAVTIEIKNGGINLIRVTDNGHGINKEQVKTAFLNHATSKIKDIKDFDTLGTLGFRGEALCTIAAVSNIEMQTRTRAEHLGAYIKIQGGNFLEQKEIAINFGTTVIVQNLFYNTPARLKFLKKPSVEASHISSIINKLALANPDIAFKFINNDKLAFSTSGDGDLKSALICVLGRDINKNVLDINSSDKGFYLNGFISRPGYSRSSRAQQNFFINSRYIKNDIAVTAIESAYKNNNKLTVGQFPVYALNLVVDPSFIDINVHPSKLEVRFASDDMVYDFVFNTINNRLKDDNLINKTEISLEFGQREGVKNDKLVTQSTGRNKIDLNLDNNKDVFAETKTDFKICKPCQSQKYEFKHQKIINADPVQRNSIIKKNKIDNTIKYNDFIQEDLIRLKNNLFENYKIIGCMFNTYWVIQKDKNIFLMDQHAAHERVLFEELKNKYDKKNILSQRLICDISFELVEYDRNILLDNLDSIKDWGFDIEYISNRFVIRAVPHELRNYVDKDFFVDLVESLRERSLPIDKKSLVDKINMFDVIRQACKKAVKAKDKLSYSEVKELINKIMSAENPFNCPHGRPVLIKISIGEIEKLFMRKK